MDYSSDYPPSFPDIAHRVLIWFKAGANYL